MRRANIWFPGKGSFTILLFLDWLLLIWKHTSPSRRPTGQLWISTIQQCLKCAMWSSVGYTWPIMWVICCRIFTVGCFMVVFHRMPELHLQPHLTHSPVLCKGRWKWEPVLYGKTQACLGCQPESPGGLVFGETLGRSDLMHYRFLHGQLAIGQVQRNWPPGLA